MIKLIFEDKYLVLLTFSLIFFFSKKGEYYSLNIQTINHIAFENEYKKFLCKILKNSRSQVCFDEIFNNSNYFTDINKISGNIFLLIDLNRSNIENLLLLIGTIPFLRNNSFISYNIKNEKTLNIFKELFNYKSFINKSINLKENDFNLTKNKIINSFNYTWEIIPSKNIINIIRYILNNYYEETFLQLFEGFLNFNYKYYLKTKILSFDILKGLISKFIKQI